MSTRSAREYTMFTPAQHLRRWRKQRPSNQGDLDSSVTWEVGRVYYTGVDLLFISFHFIFVPQYVIVVELRFKSYTLYNNVAWILKDLAVQLVLR
jgi:hypothetical protein